MSNVTGCIGGVLADPQAYFFSVIGRAAGGPANDWQAVLDDLHYNKGMPKNPARGVPIPADAPFYGITIMVGGDGHSRGRIWLPTTQPEPGGWYTHEIQVIADGPMPGTFVWAWQDIGGAPYVPRPCGSTVPPDPPTPPSDNLEQRVTALEADVLTLKEQMEGMDRRILALARGAIAGATIDVRVGSNWGHGHPASATIRP